MTARTSHVGKTAYERDYYKKRIHEVNYDPTNDESLEFDQSDDTKKDYSPTTGGRLQKEGFNHKISHFFKENLFGIIISAIGSIAIFVLSFFAVTLNRESGVQQQKIENISEKVGTVNETLNKQTDTLFDLRIVISEIKKDIEYINKEIEKKK